MRHVAVLTPCHDGRVSAIYAHNLAESVAHCLHIGVRLSPVFWPGEAMVQIARSRLLEIAVEASVDAAIWIDADIGWSSGWIVSLINDERDVVGGTYRRKTDDGESYVVKANPSSLSSGVIPVEALGLGFVKMSRAAMRALLSAGDEYIEDGQSRRWAFPVHIEKGVLMSEDVRAFSTLNRLGFKPHLNTAMTCSHTGSKTFFGDFSAFMEKINPGPSMALH